VRPDGRSGPSPRRPPAPLVTSTSVTAPDAAPPITEPEAVARRGWGIDALAVVALVAAAVALRVRPLAPPSLWIDDAWVSLLYKVDSISDVRRISVASPGFVALLKLWFNIGGFSNFRAQAPAFAFGVLGAPVLYFTARSWRLGRAAALFAGGLLVVSPVHMRYSARVKAFTLEALAAAVLLLIADRLCSDPLRRSRWYAFAIAAAIATALSAPLVIIAVPGFVAGVVALRRAGERIPRAAVGAAAGYTRVSASSGTPSRSGARSTATSSTTGTTITSRTAASATSSPAPVAASVASLRASPRSRPC
jgi:hypothetical protein